MDFAMDDAIGDAMDGPVDTITSHRVANCTTPHGMQGIKSFNKRQTRPSCERFYGVDQEKGCGTRRFAMACGTGKIRRE